MPATHSRKKSWGEVMFYHCVTSHFPLTSLSNCLGTEDTNSFPFWWWHAKFSKNCIADLSDDIRHTFLTSNNPFQMRLSLVKSVAFLDVVNISCICRCSDKLFSKVFLSPYSNILDSTREIEDHGHLTSVLGLAPHVQRFLWMCSSAVWCFSSTNYK